MATKLRAGCYKSVSKMILHGPSLELTPPSCSQFCGLFKRLVSFHARNNAERPPKRQGFLKEPNLLIYREMRHPEIGALIPNAKVARPYLAVLRHQF